MKESINDFFINYSTNIDLNNLKLIINILIALSLNDK